MIQRTDLLRLSLTIAITLLMLHGAKGQDSEVSWQRKPDFSGGARDDGATFSLHGMGYYCAGADFSFNLRNDCWQFNPSKSEWEEVARIPGRPRQYSLGFSSDSLGFVFGGIVDTGAFLNTLEVYNPNSDRWSSQITPLPPMAKSTGVRLGEYFYLIGGQSDSLILNDFWRYGFKSNAWKQLDFVRFSPRFDMIAYEVGGRLYFGLGRDSNTFFNDIWQFDVISEQWKQLTDFEGNSRTYVCVLDVPSGALIVGGNDVQGNLLNEVYHWDDQNQVWLQTVNLFPLMVRGMKGITIDDQVLLIGGLTSNFTRISNVYELDFTTIPSEYGLKVWPNPVRTDVSVTIEIGSKCDDCNLEVFDISGEFIHVSFDIVTSHYMQFKTSKLDNGVYQLRHSNGDIFFIAPMIIIK